VDSIGTSRPVRRALEAESIPDGSRQPPFIYSVGALASLSWIPSKQKTIPRNARVHQRGAGAVGLLVHLSRGSITLWRGVVCSVERSFGRNVQEAVRRLEEKGVSGPSRGTPRTRAA
jgi:hypothetical protein